MINRLIFISIDIYILLAGVLLNRESLKITSVLMACTVLFFTLLNMKSKGGRTFSDKELKAISALTLSYMVIVAVSKYAVTSTLIVYIFIILVAVVFGVKDRKVPDNLFQKFFDYALALTLLLLWCISALRNINDYREFVIPSAWDKNYTGMTIFLIFSYYFKRKFYIGLIPCILYSLTLSSRLYQLCILLLVIFTIIIRIMRKKESKFFYKLLNIDHNIIFLIAILSAVFVVLFSFFWMLSISSRGVSQYQQSWNDTSNAIRTRSNVYATLLISSDPELIVRGYDDDITKVLGVEDETSSTRFYGFRLVQPHHLVLNLLLRHGFAFTICYIFLLSVLVEKYCTIDNIPLIMVYFLANMVMHSLLSSTYLLMFFFALSATPPKRKIVLRWNKMKLRIS